MSKLRNSASSQPTVLTVHVRDRGEELAAQADLKLARYPAEVRHHVAELLRVLVAKPGRGRKRSSIRDFKNSVAVQQNRG
jgi:hypothetical protein